MTLSLVFQLLAYYFKYTILNKYWFPRNSVTFLSNWGLHINMKGVIYKYTFPNGKVYIGQTINPRSRKTQHLSPSTGARNVGFWRAYKKYGSFDYEEIEEVNAPTEELLRDRLNDLEQHYIAEYKSNDRRYGYNLTSGGSVFVVNEEGRKHMSEARTDKIPVLQYTLSGDFVAEYESTAAAAKAIGSHASSVYACCVGESRSKVKRHKVQMVKGHTFRFKKDYPDVPKHIDVKLTSIKKKVLQYSLSGHLVREWDSIVEAEEAMNAERPGIRQCCYGKYRQSCGYMWRLMDENGIIPRTIPPVRPKLKKPFPKLSPEQVAKGKQVHFERYARPVYQFTFDGVFVSEYPSTKDAAIAVGGDRGTICNACKHQKVLSAYGYQWRYKSDVPEPNRGIERYIQEFGPRKAILQYTKEGALLREWHCAKDIAEHLGVRRNSVYMVLDGRMSSIKGFVLKYKIN